MDKSTIDCLVLNTGRSLAATQIIADAINSDKVKYLLAEHGAIGYRHDKQEEVDLKSLAKKLPGGEVNYDSLASIPTLIEWYNSFGQARLAAQIGFSVDASQKIANLTLKVPAEVSGSIMLSALKELILDNSPVSNRTFVYHHSVTDGYVDVMADIDKGTGVRLIKYLEASPALQCFAIGNGLNDIPMFREVDSFCCPVNSDAYLVGFCRDNNGKFSEHAFVEASIEWLRSTLPGIEC